MQPGVTLAQLDEAAAGQGLFYPVYPGEMSASLGGTIATNAGGMRAVKYGVTRQHVLGSRRYWPPARCCARAGKSSRPARDTTSPS